MDETLPRITACGTNESQYAPAFGREICAQVAMGRSLAAVCRQAGMPHRTTVRGWLNRVPAFAAAMRAARRQARRDEQAWRDMRRALMLKAAEARPTRRGGRACTYDEAVGEAICRRIAAGEALNAICRDEGMPCAVTVYGWLKRHAAFREIYALAREMQADAKFDEAWATAEAATPQTVKVARLRFDVIRWQAARLAPRKYGERLDADEDEAPAGLTVVIRRFGPDGEDEVLEPVGRYDA